MTLLYKRIICKTKKGDDYAKIEKEGDSYIFSYYDSWTKRVEKIDNLKSEQQLRDSTADFFIKLNSPDLVDKELMFSTALVNEALKVEKGSHNPQNNGSSVSNVSPSVSNITTTPSKNAKIKQVKHETNETNETNETLEGERFIKKPNNSKNELVNVSDVSLVSQNTSISEYFIGDKLLHLIFLLKTHAEMSYDSMSDESGYPNGTIRTIVANRNKDYFIQAGKKDKKTLWKLSEMGQSFFSDQLEIAEKIQSKRNKDSGEIEKEISDYQDFNTKCQDIIKNVNYNRCEDFLVFDYMNIAKHNPEVADLILNKPEETFEMFDTVLEENYNNGLQFKVINLPHTNCMSIQDLRAEHMYRLISLTARLTSFGSVLPLVKNIIFECPSCGSIISVLQGRNDVVKEPTRCSCGRRGNFKEISRECENVCRLILEDIQDMTDNPHTERIVSIIEGKLTNDENIKIFHQPGNELRCVGILKEVRKRKIGGESTLMNYEFDILYATTLEDELNLEDFAEEDLDDIKKVCMKIDEEGLNILNESFAPEVEGNNHVKQAVMLQIAASRNNVNNPVRSKPNVLLIGDPGIAKSVTAKYAVKVTQNSKKAVGGGSSAVGITAAVVKEEDSLGGYRVEPGAMVLAKDILFLDELNNLSDDDKPKLQEGMNEMSVTINKASIRTRLPVICGIIATANPNKGSFDPAINLVRQFDIPQAILNRFDLVFALRDCVDTETDGLIADKMIARESNQLNPEHDYKFIKKLFYYIRHQEEPEITEETKKNIKKLYIEFRKKKTFDININPRFLESLLRLIKSHAKCRLSSTVDKKDILSCIEIIEHTYYNHVQEERVSNLTPTKRGVDTLLTPSKQQKLQSDTSISCIELLEALKILENETGELVPLEKIKTLPFDNVEDLISKLKKQGLVYEPRKGYVQLMK